MKVPVPLAMNSTLRNVAGLPRTNQNTVLQEYEATS